MAGVAVFSLLKRAFNVARMAKQSLKTSEMLAAICERLLAGESLRSICRSEGFPPNSTVLFWCANDTEWAKQYARAKQIGLEVLADEILDISDDGTNDWMESHDPRNPGYDANGEHMQRSKLRVDTRKWLLSRLLPKKYGDKQAVEHSGGFSLSVATGVPDETDGLV